MPVPASGGAGCPWHFLAVTVSLQSCVCLHTIFPVLRTPVMLCQGLLYFTRFQVCLLSKGLGGDGMNNSFR